MQLAANLVVCRTKAGNQKGSAKCAPKAQTNDQNGVVARRGIHFGTRTAEVDPERHEEKRKCRSGEGTVDALVRGGSVVGVMGWARALGLGGGSGSMRECGHWCDGLGGGSGLGEGSGQGAKRALT